MVVVASCLTFSIHEVRTMKHNWLAWCHYNVTGWGAMWAYDMLFQLGITINL